MKYIKDFREGDQISGVYLCRSKQSLVSAKTGKSYDSAILQDKTGIIDAKIWDPASPAINDYDNMDYVFVNGEVTVFNSKPQLKIARLRVARENEYLPSDYVPSSDRNVEEMYAELMGLVNSVKNEYLKALLNAFFVEDQAFIKTFKKRSAAKSVHHGFLGGLLQHTLSVANHCDYFAKVYPILNRDLLISAAICHDIGKTKELSDFPLNDYTDEGQLIGHIVIGVEMVGVAAAKIEGFPERLLSELKHCIIAHHGEYEFGSPKKPALIEALVLSYADNIDAKVETVSEFFENVREDDLGWLGYNKWVDSNLRRTGK